MVSSKRPRQLDIARLANVSQAAVSLVLNGTATEKGISAATQERIRAAMVQLAYVPNIAARSLRGARSGLIGVHTFEPAFPVSPDSYYNEFLTGVEAQAVDDGQDLVLFASTKRGPDVARSIYWEGFNRLRIADGAVMLGVEKNDAELARLASEGFDFVYIGRREVPGVPVSYVTADYFNAMQSVVSALTTAGHSSALYLGQVPRPSPQVERMTGIRRFAGEAGLAVQTLLAEPSDISAGWLRNLIDGGVSAVIVESYELARAMRSAVSDAGVVVPRDLSIVCLDTDVLHDPDHAWSRVGIPRHEMGRAAVRVLLRQLDGELEPGHAEVLQCAPPKPSTIAPPRSLHS